MGGREENSRAVGDGIGVVWTLLPSAGHCVEVDRVAPTDRTQGWKALSQHTCVVCLLL